jgi:hypothetical protein
MAQTSLEIISILLGSPIAAEREFVRRLNANLSEVAGGLGEDYTPIDINPLRVDGVTSTRDLVSAMNERMTSLCAVADVSYTPVTVNVLAMDFTSLMQNNFASLDSTIADLYTAAEGGGAPEWVPANAKIHIDLVGGTPQGRAWVDGIGEVAVDTLLGSDPNTGNTWDTTGYDPADLTVNGLVYSSHPPAFIGSALSKLLAGATYVTTVRDIALNGTYRPLILASANGNDALIVDACMGSGNPNAVSVRSYFNGTLSPTIDDIVNHGEGTFNCVAVTIVEDHFDLAANGSDAVTVSISSDDRPLANPLVAALIEPTDLCALQTITIYDPLPSTAGLSELSS